MCKEDNITEVYIDVFCLLLRTLSELTTAKVCQLGGVSGKEVVSNARRLPVFVFLRVFECV